MEISHPTRIMEITETVETTEISHPTRTMEITEMVEITETPEQTTTVITTQQQMQMVDRLQQRRLSRQVILDPLQLSGCY